MASNRGFKKEKQEPKKATADEVREAITRLAGLKNLAESGGQVGLPIFPGFRIASKVGEYAIAAKRDFGKTNYPLAKKGFDEAASTLEGMMRHYFGHSPEVAFAAKVNAALAKCAECDKDADLAVTLTSQFEQYKKVALQSATIHLVTASELYYNFAQSLADTEQTLIFRRQTRAQAAEQAAEEQRRQAIAQRRADQQKQIDDARAAQQKFGNSLMAEVDMLLGDLVTEAAAVA
ncbi:MAG: hypothetical protein WCW26_00295 [Candidatus Buchananbacteria bacterium]